MKIRKYISVLIAMSLIALSSCLDNTDNTGFEPTTPELTLSGVSSNIAVERNGGEYELIINANLPWRIQSDADWIKIDKENGTGDAKCKLTVGVNKEYTDRSGVVTVWITGDSKQSITMTQAKTVPGAFPIHYFVKTNASVDNDGLSWEKPIPLDSALARSLMGDYIHVAAGTYTPTMIITNGNESNASDRTFELHSSISLIGGYPSDAVTGAVSDPIANETILSGDMGSAKAYHVVAITAKPNAEYPAFKVLIKGFTITGGMSADKNATAVSVGGVTMNRYNGGGIVVGASEVNIEDCRITGNKSGYHTAGVHITKGADVSFLRCSIDNNENVNDGSNAPGIYNEGATLRMNNCAVLGNRCGGVAGGIYAFHGSEPSYTYLYNTTIAGNNNNSLGMSTTRGGGGFYAREGSITLMVNCTISGNTGGDGAGISLYGSATRGATLDLISCTITGNTAYRNGGGLLNNRTSNVCRIYNTIISGNTAGTSFPDFGGAGGYTALSNSVLTAATYDGSGVLASVPAFDAATMFEALKNNGGYGETHKLTGTDNPAMTAGMTQNSLTTLGGTYTPAVGATIIGADQTGLSRSGKNVIGACAR